MREKFGARGSEGDEVDLGVLGRSRGAVMATHSEDLYGRRWQRAVVRSSARSKELERAGSEITVRAARPSASQIR